MHLWGPFTKIPALSSTNLVSNAGKPIQEQRRCMPFNYLIWLNQCWHQLPLCKTQRVQSEHVQFSEKQKSCWFRLHWKYKKWACNVLLEESRAAKRLWNIFSRPRSLLIPCYTFATISLLSNCAFIHPTRIALSIRPKIIFYFTVWKTSTKMELKDEAVKIEAQPVMLSISSSSWFDNDDGHSDMIMMIIVIW